MGGPQNQSGCISSEGRERIKVERIQRRIVFTGEESDALWHVYRHIRRMENQHQTLLMLFSFDPPEIENSPFRFFSSCGLEVEIAPIPLRKWGQEDEKSKSEPVPNGDVVRICLYGRDG